jgi:DNA-binding NarL/FixJ family response regulator
VPRLLVVEDHGLTALGVSALLRRHGWEVRVADELTATGVLREGRSWRPDVVLLDLHLGDGVDGGDLVAPLSALGIAVVVVTGQDDPARWEAVQRAGALAVVSKGAPVDDVIAAVRAVAPTPTDGGGAPTPDPFSLLTARERRVLASLMDGLTAEQIAAAHVVSLPTVRTQIRGVLQKLGVHSQLAAVAKARREGWTDGDG